MSQTHFKIHLPSALVIIAGGVIWLVMFAICGGLRVGG